ncbi:MAG: DUF1963 domain-containing protein [Alphaproteobacteria bacterium]|nr:DUF1963 domain-containing protein [Alphaproteobacteria bacterium]
MALRPEIARRVARMDAFTEAMGRDCSVAECGPLAPDASPFASRLLGPGMLRPDEPWPTHEGRPMYSLLQVNLGEAPAVPEPLRGYAWMGVYLDPSVMLIDQLWEGEGWALRLYRDLTGLAPRPSPQAKPRGNWTPQAITWTPFRDIPHPFSDLAHALPPPWDDLIDDVSIIWYRAFPGGRGARHATCTKLGGFASIHQDECPTGRPDAFVFQIKANPDFDLCDNTTTYVGLIDGEWVMETQTS